MTQNDNGYIVSFEERKSSVLTPSSLACLSKTTTVNLSRGCAHQCLYCYTRGYSSWPGENKIVVYSNTFEKIQKEFARRRKTPECVYFSPSSDLFQPIPEILELGYQILQFLFQNHVNVAVLTKGKIPQEFYPLFEQYKKQVQFQMGLVTLNNEILSIFEPNAPCAEARLDQIKQLTSLGIPVRARLDPILPGLTDDKDSLNNLCEQLKTAGVRELAASVLFMRPSILSSLKKNIQNEGIKQCLIDRFRFQENLEIHAGQSRVFALNSDERFEILERVRSIAAEHEIVCRLCSCKNPDMNSSSCRIAGEWKQNQNPLFDLD
ncbi:MAG: radical SAM protein [Planctomycetia bacterium]|nr:radical SAM protein [Planctomycetia bacterium]